MYAVFLWCYVCFVLLRFRLYAFVEAAALRSIVLRYAGAPIATRVYFCLFGDVAFSEYFFCTIPAFSLYGEYVILDHGLDFWHHLMLINQSINHYQGYG